MNIDDENNQKSESAAKVAVLRNWLSNAKKASTEFESVAKEAWAEYLAKNGKSSDNLSEINKTSDAARYPIFYSSIENLQPAYYARTPETVAKRMFDHDDDVARVACLILERLSKYLLQVYPIDTAMSNAVLEFLISGRGTARIFLEEEKEIVTTQVQIYQNEQGEFVNNDGSIADITAGVIADEQGNYFTEATEDQITKVCTHVLPLNYDDIYINQNARNWNEVTRIAIKMWLTKADFQEKFGEELATKINYETLKNKEESNSDKAYKVSEGVEVFEIWDKTKKKVIYICESYQEDVLLEIEDPYLLRDFFPVAPFLIATKDPKSYFPTPMYRQLKSTIAQLHLIYSRIKNLIKGLRRKGIVDSSLQDILSAVDSEEEGTLISSAKFQHLVENSAGVGGLITWLPLGELSQALSESQKLISQYEDIFFKISGVPDVIRGITEKGQTATEQQLKGQFYNVRTSWNAHQVQELARKLIEMQCDLALHRMPDDLIANVCGFQYLDQTDQVLIPQALELIRNDEARTVRIDIETDSLTFMLDEVKQQKKNTLITTVIEGIGKIADVSKNNPAALPLVTSLLLMSIRGMNLGKTYEAGIREITQSLQQQAQAPQQEAPPPPDSEMLKLQIEIEKLILQNKELELTTTLKNKELEIESAKNITDQQLDKLQQDTDERFNNLTAIIEQQKLELEQARIILSEKEKLMEERRLSEAKIYEQMNTIKQSNTAPAFTINTNGGAKEVTIVRSDDGSMRGIITPIAGE